MMIEHKARQVVALLRERGLRVASAESCTGGLLAAALTDVGGASAVFDFGAVTYSNGMKEKLLGVRRETLAAYGAVSAQTAREMAKGIMEFAGAQIGVGITGIAGPASDGTDKPVGLIYVCVRAADGDCRVTELRNRFTGDVRTQNRQAAVAAALDMLIAYLMG